MPIGRGENIGTAYVRIVGDGSGLPDDIRRGFRDAEPSVREAGDDHGNAYTDAVGKAVRRGYEKNFGEGNTQTNIFARLNDQLTSSLARLELADRTFKSAKWREFQERLKSEGGAAGELLAQRIADRFRDSGNLDQLADSMRTYGPDLRRAQADILRMLEEDQRASDQRTLEQGRMVLQARAMMERDFAQRQQRLQTAGQQHAAALAENRRRDMDSLRTSLTRYLDTLERVERGERVSGGSRRNMIRDFEALRTQATRTGVSFADLGRNFGDIDLRTRRLHPTLLRFNQVLDDSAQRTGRMFGRGSRSNILNFFGGMVTGALRVAFLLPKLAAVGLRVFDTLTSVASRTARAFDDVRAGGGSMLAAVASGGRAAVAGLAVSMETAGIALLGFVAAAAAALLVLGPLVAGISLLIGAVTALVSTLTLGAGAALFALAGAFVPLAVGIGVAVAAFKNLDKESRQSLTRVKDAVSELGKAAAEGLQFARVDHAEDHWHTVRTFEQQMKEIASLIQMLAPLTRNVGRALGDALDIFIDRVGGANGVWSRFIDKIDGDQSGERIGWLARQVRTLGRIGTESFGGFLGLFQGMMPLIQRFLNWARDLTIQFNEWANSEDGLKTMHEWFERAGDSAAALGDWIGAAWDLLGQLITAGSGAGDSIFGDLADKFREWTDAIRDNPDILTDWFSNARRFAQQLGNAILGIAEILDALDTPRNRDLIIDFFTGMGKLAEGVAKVIDGISGAIGGIGAAVDAVGGAVGGFFSSIGGGGGGGGGFDQGLVISKFSGLGPKILKAIGRVDIKDVIKMTPLGFILSRFDGLGNRIKKVIGKANIADLIIGIPRALASLLNPFKGADGKVVRNIGKANVAGIIIGVAKALLSLINPFNNADSKVLRAIGKPNVSGFITGTAQALTRLVSTFNPAARQILNAIGNVDVSGIISGAGEAATGLVNAFSGLASRIVSAIGTIVPHVNLPDIPGIGPPFMTGGIITEPTVALMGERRLKEAVVPLELPLSQVDPAVRELAAYARGAKTSSTSPGAGTSIGRQVNADIVVQLPTGDPYAAAAAVVDRLAVVGY